MYVFSVQCNMKYIFLVCRLSLLFFVCIFTPLCGRFPDWRTFLKIDTILYMVYVGLIHCKILQFISGLVDRLYTVHELQINLIFTSCRIHRIEKTVYICVVVSNMFYFHPYLGKIPILTNILQRGWNHQPDIHVFVLGEFRYGFYPR